MKVEASLPKILVDRIVCPVCRGELVSRDPMTLECVTCGVGYPVREGIPILLRPELRPGQVAESPKAVWKQREAQLFDEMPPDYADSLKSAAHSESPFRTKSEAAVRRALATVPTGGAILDVGGASLGTLGEDATHAATVLFEISTRFLLRQNGARVAGDIEELPFRDSAFDLVLVSGVIHHVPDQESALKEIGRVLKPGGRALLNEPSKWSVALAYYLVKRAARRLVGDDGLRKYLRYYGSPRESYVSLRLVKRVFASPSFQLTVAKSTPLRFAFVGGINPGPAYYALQNRIEESWLTDWFGSAFIAEVTKR